MQFANDRDCFFFAWRHYKKNAVRDKMKQNTKMCGITAITPHGLRHSSVKETLDIYLHLFPNKTVGVIDKIFNN